VIVYRTAELVRRCVVAGSAVFVLSVPIAILAAVVHGSISGLVIALAWGCFLGWAANELLTQVTVRVEVEADGHCKFYAVRGLTGECQASEISEIATQRGSARRIRVRFPAGSVDLYCIADVDGFISSVKGANPSVRERRFAWGWRA
jgi:hypothetical protein